MTKEQFISWAMDCKSYVDLYQQTSKILEIELFDSALLAGPLDLIQQLLFLAVNKHLSDANMDYYSEQFWNVMFEDGDITQFLEEIYENIKE